MFVYRKAPNTFALNSTRIDDPAIVPLPTGAAFRNLGRRRSLSRELFDGSVSQASRIEEGVKNCLWHSLLAATYCQTRNGWEVPEADQARSKSGRVVTYGS